MRVRRTETVMAAVDEAGDAVEASSGDIGPGTSGEAGHGGPGRRGRGTETRGMTNTSTMVEKSRTVKVGAVDVDSALEASEEGEAAVVSVEEWEMTARVAVAEGEASGPGASEVDAVGAASEEAWEAMVRDGEAVAADSEEERDEAGAVIAGATGERATHNYPTLRQGSRSKNGYF